jgi:glycosyltransferase involved in cell wall biosynthesis
MSDPAPEVTGIIVVMDGEAYIREAIDSILGQVGVDIELVVVDDGSTDRTMAIVGEYVAARPDRVRLITHPGGENRGIAASRNLGLSVARGSFIAFLDADDIWMPGKTAEQLAVFRQHPEVGLVYGRTLLWHSWTPQATREDYYVPLGVEPDRVHQPPLLFTVLVANRHQSPTVCNAIMRRTLFDRVGAFDPRFRGMFEDATFFTKALATVPVYVSDRTWAKYRQHPASHTAQSAARGRDEIARLRFLLDLSRTIGQYSTDPQVKAAMRAAIRHAAIRVVRGPLGRLRRRLFGDTGKPAGPPPQSTSANNGS